ncbi:KAP family NTPase [Vibrio porteresiae]|uniref:KAP family NTPase n=1 Tax=Vibrio porteresiae DSM 19223 TaxID=1123496 RepID=A0ABZ0QG34_9VIBR|nr:KAP family NTPase [Vibrio porteresiae]WPC74946.1 KAP family NTPase [Vibrio porteresiae DSM 19223]
MKQVKQIIELLEDESFPQVVLIDGAWGSGKTYFIRKSLIEALNSKFKQSVFYFSLYGISSIDDFRDKIISLSMTGDENASSLGKIATKIIDGAANLVGEKGVGAILSGAAGAYKYSLYSTLDNCIFILDDLERIPDENVIKNILGECLNLAESKNIKVLVVANEDKLDCKSDLEKVFADKYKFGFTHEKIVDILKQEYKLSDNKITNEIILNITSLDSKNIRVLKRSIAKFLRIKREIENIENVIVDQALSRVLADIIRICYARFELGYSKEMILDATNTRLLRHVANKDNDDVDSDYDVLDNIFNNSIHSINEKLLTYCCDGLFEFDNLTIELNLPIKGTLIDSMKSPWAQNRLTDEEFSKGVTLLEEFMEDSSTKIKMYEWFEVCDTYIYLLENRIIDSTKYSKDTILKMCHDISIDRFLLPEINSYYDREIRSEFYCHDVLECYKNKNKQLMVLAKSNKENNFTKRFIKSWFNVQDEAHQSLMHTPIYQNLDGDIVRKALINWSNEEVYEFVRFNKERYKFSNIYDYFAIEIESLKNLAEKLEMLSNELGFGLKVANISELRKCFIDSSSRMEFAIEAQNTAQSAS